MDSLGMAHRTVVAQCRSVMDTRGNDMSASTATRGLNLQALATINGLTLRNLAVGGFAGLGLWEIFSAVPTALLAGTPLEPPELVRSLFFHQFGLNVPLVWAKALHYLTGVLLYPLGYFILSRAIKSFGWPADGWIWGVITYFIALGFFAPLAGQPFLIHTIPMLSFMSLVGHALYGWLAAWVFERLEMQAS
jgi:hypothetical protein